VKTARYDTIGSGLDRVTLRIGGDAIQIWSQYELHLSVFSQPSAFTMTLGRGDRARELLETYPPNASFELLVGDVVVMTGAFDSVDVPSGSVTQISITGRDGIAALFDDYIQAEQSFSESSYLQLTRKMLDAVGLEERTIATDNTANRKAVTGHTVTEVAVPVSSETLQIEDAATTQKKIEYKTIKAKLTETRWTFLEREYKKAGIFLWCKGDGNYVLARPNPAQSPGSVIRRQRGMTRDLVNVLDHRYHRTKVNRFARTICYGRGGGGKTGRAKFKAIIEDPEMMAWGCRNTKAFTDTDAKSDRQANFIARRDVAQQRRDGWQLEYTMSGHAIWSAAQEGKIAVWGIDTVCRVEDDELGITGEFYVSDVTFRGGESGTTTTIRLMRPEDLLFAEDEDPELKKHIAKQPKGHARAKPPEQGKTVAIDWEAGMNAAYKNSWWNRTKGQGFKPLPTVTHRDSAEQARQDWLAEHATPEQAVAVQNYPGMRTF
jgi:prophage tail gpP-like protein